MNTKWIENKQNIREVYDYAKGLLETEEKMKATYPARLEELRQEHPEEDLETVEFAAYIQTWLNTEKPMMPDNEDLEEVMNDLLECVFERDMTFCREMVETLEPHVS